jgi:hypothetical protein
VVRLRDISRYVVPRAGLEPARITPHAPQTCAATNYATSAIRFWILDLGFWISPQKKRFDPPTSFKSLFQKNYLFAGVSVFAGAATFAFDSAGAAAFVFATGAAVFALASLTFAFASAGTTDSAGASSLLCSTETLPLSAGIEISNADTIKNAAAAIVNFERTDAVPRGPNAALETLLVNKAPASVFPGCSSTEPTSTMHEIKNIAYKTYNNFLIHLFSS